MCNAWNHPPGCMCGWGGEGHLGRCQAGDSSLLTFILSTDRDRDWQTRSITSTYESYVNPNAICPVCGAPVFFYRSPEGGRVFFDELGPPWPKHPCTDSNGISAAYMTITRVPDKPIHQPTYQWQRKRWLPFFLSLVLSVDTGVLQIRGTLAGKEIDLYVRKILSRHEGKIPITTQSVAFLRRNAEGAYDLSFLASSDRAIRMTVFTSISKAREDNFKANSVKKASTVKNRKHRKQAKGKAKGKSRTSKETTMALAFARAKPQKGET